MSHRLKLLVCAAFAAVFVTACGSTQAPTAVQAGSMSLALTSVSGATTYQLVGAKFDLSGRQSKEIVPNPSDATFRVDLPTGGYTITLETGWHIEANGTPIPATLVAGASQNFFINDQQVTYLAFAFRAGADVIQFGDGRLTVGITVEDASNGCVVSGDSCTGATINCAGNSLVQNACQISTGPSNVTISCDGATDVTIPLGAGIDPTRYADGLRQLAEIQRGALAWFAIHGTYPVATAASTPGATCCAAGGVFQCAANPNAWIGVAAWDELGFVIDGPHSFVFSYNGTTGDTLQAIAEGDLDCDTTVFDLTLNCTTLNGTPSCSMTIPSACDGNGVD